MSLSPTQSSQFLLSSPLLRRTIRFAADTADERDHWVRALQAAAQKCDAKAKMFAPNSRQWETAATIASHPVLAVPEREFLERMMGGIGTGEALV